MTQFLRSVVGASRTEVAGASADMFVFADGSAFAVASPGGMGADRSVGFLVDDLDDAVRDLRSTGVVAGPPAINGLFRYVHFRAPDGHVYELMERVLDPRPGRLQS
jgi:glyoxylase I family protein